MLHELGILFSIDEIPSSNYRAEAWKIFMRTCDPKRLAGSTLYEGETSDSPGLEENIFCIAIQSLDQQVIDYVKAAFIRSDAPGMMPKGQRFLGGWVTLRFPLLLRARIDEDGRFRSWDEASVRQDQRLCHEAGWRFGETARASNPVT
jgi:hypothetical protein